MSASGITTHLAGIKE